MLGAATKRQVISRVLGNLKTIYLRERDFERALRTVDFLTLVTPWDLDQIRDRGMLHYHLGDNMNAVADLETYVEHGEPGPRLERAREALRAIAPR
jgi:regulator of sirC expression with transglutaminase-like and TPR domain